jgi:hypothetical protein
MGTALLGTAPLNRIAGLIWFAWPIIHVISCTVQSSVCQMLFQELVAQLDQKLEVLEAEMLRLAQAAHREAIELLECVEKQC